MKKNIIYLILAIVIVGGILILMANTILWQTREMTSMQKRVANLEIVINHEFLQQTAEIKKPSIILPDGTI